MALPAAIATTAAVFTGLNMLGKLFGSDPDFTQAWMLNRMRGRGGFLKTFFADGLKKMFLGSRSRSAMMSGGIPFGASLYGSPAFAQMMGPLYADPYRMTTMPYCPCQMGAMMWGV